MWAMWAVSVYVVGEVLVARGDRVAYGYWCADGNLRLPHLEHGLCVPLCRRHRQPADHLAVCHRERLITSEGPLANGLEQHCMPLQNVGRVGNQLQHRDGAPGRGHDRVAKATTPTELGLGEFRCKGLDYI